MDHYQFMLAYGTFFVISLLFSSHIVNIVDINNNNQMICVNRDYYLDLLHYCNTSQQNYQIVTE